MRTVAYGSRWRRQIPSENWRDFQGILSLGVRCLIFGSPEHENKCFGTLPGYHHPFRPERPGIADETFLVSPSYVESLLVFGLNLYWLHVQAINLSPTMKAMDSLGGLLLV